MATEAGPSFRQSHGALCEGTHPFATPVFGVAVTLGIILGSLKQEPPSPFRGNELSLAAAVEIPHYPPWVLNSGKLVWRPWDRRSGFQVGVLVVSGTGAGLNRCGMLPASVLQPTSAFPRLLFPSPVNVTLKQLGRGVGWECGGKWNGRMPGFALPGRCQELPKQKTTEVCLSFIYANEPVVISPATLRPRGYWSLVPSVVWCPPVPEKLFR